MMGDFQKWNANEPIVMEKIGDGLYKAVVTTTAEKSWFKFYRAYDTTNLLGTTTSIPVYWELSKMAMWRLKTS